MGFNFPVTKPTVSVDECCTVVDDGYINLLDIVCMTCGFSCHQSKKCRYTLMINNKFKYN